MLFADIYTFKEDLSEENQKRVVQVFTSWAPPAGVEFKAHYEFADGSGGIVIMEVSTAAALYEGNVAFSPFMHFRVEPLVDIKEGVPIEMKVFAWRDSVR
jgi:hypothetical protein